MAPPRGARRNTPGSARGCRPGCPRRLPTLLCPLVASPRHPPSLAGSPLSGSSASPVFPGAQSTRRGRGHPPRPPCLAARTAWPNTETQVILLLCTEVSRCPLGAHLPPPQQGPSRLLAALEPPQGPDPRMRGSWPHAPPGAPSPPLPAPGQRGRRPRRQMALAAKGRRETPPRPPGLVARTRAGAAGATRSSSRPRRPPAGAAGSRSCAPRDRGGPRSAAAAR